MGNINREKTLDTAGVIFSAALSLDDKHIIKARDCIRRYSATAPHLMTKVNSFDVLYNNILYKNKYLFFIESTIYIT